jgi:hypothetical protein
MSPPQNKAHSSGNKSSLRLSTRRASLATPGKQAIEQKQ